MSYNSPIHIIHTQNILTMTDYWQDLIQQQAKLTDDQDLNSHSYFTALPQLGIVQVSGEEAESFLQNLLTNDVAAIELNQAQLSGFCNAKGRLFALFLLIRRSEAYQIILPKSMCSLLQQRLTMYKLRSKITITDESDNLICVGLTTPKQNQLANPQLVQHPSDSTRFLSICDHTNIENLISEFKQQNSQLAPQKIWELLDIQKGIPTIWPESKEKFTPQQVNLDLIGGVSFSKGCYPGQEVVARLHYLGKPSRRLFIAEANTTQLPNVADEITDEDGVVAGHIVSVQQTELIIKLLLSLKLTAEDTPLLLGNSIPVKVQKDEKS